MPLIIIPAVCKEKGRPFGNADVCYNQGIAYSSLSMAISSVYIWLYVYNMVRIFSSKNSEDNIDSTIRPENVPRPLLPLNTGCSPKDTSEGNPKIIGFMVGGIPQLRKVLIGDNAPLWVVQDTTSLLGTADREKEGVLWSIYGRWKGLGKGYDTQNSKSYPQRRCSYAEVVKEDRTRCSEDKTEMEKRKLSMSWTGTKDLEEWMSKSAI
ncbi:hypothetical protein LWI28_021951 [Acer negundo]|uniref:Uncharacterized protein n=1 Tax=Acer negundo TaxID=4023 RepID=A0AAD5JRX0_ACENE|nr:hypothetical protein LWI28_021951 [Acer negundo]